MTRIFNPKIQNIHKKYQKKVTEKEEKNLKLILQSEAFRYTIFSVQYFETLQDIDLGEENHGESRDRFPGEN